MKVMNAEELASFLNRQIIENPDLDIHEVRLTNEEIDLIIEALEMLNASSN